MTLFYKFHNVYVLLSSSPLSSLNPVFPINGDVHHASCYCSLSLLPCDSIFSIFFLAPKSLYLVIHMIFYIFLRLPVLHGLLTSKQTLLLNTWLYHRCLSPSIFIKSLVVFLSIHFTLYIALTPYQSHLFTFLNTMPLYHTA